MAVSEADDEEHVSPNGGYLAFDQHSPSTQPVDLATFSPPDPTRFGLNIDIWTDRDGFEVLACSPLWLAEHFKPGPPAQFPMLGPTPRPIAAMWSDSGSVMFGRGMMFLERWDFQKFEAAVIEIFSEYGAPTPKEAALQVDRVFPWEFADY